MHAHRGTDTGVSRQHDNTDGGFHIAQGKSNKLIASELNRSLTTVATHVRAILNKTHTANRTEAAAFAAEHKLFQAN
jgi:hypothetical protein